MLLLAVKVLKFQHANDCIISKHNGFSFVHLCARVKYFFPYFCLILQFLSISTRKFRWDECIQVDKAIQETSKKYILL